DLVVYTAQPTWTMPQALWTALQLHALDQPIHVSVRGAHYNGSTLDMAAAGGLAGDIRISPVAATGSIVYWTSSSQTGASLKGFDVGDENVKTVLTPANAGVGCVGCHSSTPDGKFVAFDANPATEDGRPAHVDLRSL